MPTFLEKEGVFTVTTTVKDGLVTEKRTQDVEPVLDANGRLANDTDGYSPSRDLQHVASIPLVVWEQWLQEGLDPNDDMALMRKLNNGDWAKLRTGAGRI
jgi:hypothetical protein